ncbi:MAG: hypothetical protein NT133_17495 [Alphaproteobacteria bacterium]|nr:hypothetical protein [Alphaproteobacteria bacterium]
MLEPSGFREAIKTADVSHPIPFLFVVLLAFAVSCFGVAVLAGDLLRWVVAGAGVIAMTSAIGMAIFAMIARPELLRSERHSLVTRAIDILGDSDMDPVTVESVERMVVETGRWSLSQERSRKGRKSGPSGIEDNSNG